jgi:DNA-binding transcriptional MerR regulator
MAQVSIAEAARLTDVSEKTIRRKIASGELSAQVHGQGGQGKKLLDTSELLRVFGALPGQPSPAVHPQSPVTSTQMPDTSTLPAASFQQIIEAKQALIDVLQAQLDARTQETRELRAQVAGLLEWRRPEPAPEASSATTPVEVPPAPASPDRLAKVNLVLVVLSVALSLFAWTWALGYRPWFM